MKEKKYKSKFVGFFPKVPCPKPKGFKSDKIKEICSVSECISQGPENWIHKWEHNNLGFFDTEEKMIKCNIIFMHTNYTLLNSLIMMQPIIRYL